MKVAQLRPLWGINRRHDHPEVIISPSRTAWVPDASASGSATETPCHSEAEAGTVPRAYQARASRVNDPSGRADRHALRTRACCSPVSVVKY